MYCRFTWNLYSSLLRTLLSTVPPNIYISLLITSASWKRRPDGTCGELTHKCATVIHKVHRFRILFEQTTNVLRLTSHLVPKNGARVRFTLGANVSTHFSQVLTREFGRYARASVIGHQIVPVSLEYPESEHNTVLCRRPGTSARAPSVITASHPNDLTYLTILCWLYNLPWFVVKGES